MAAIHDQLPNPWEMNPSKLPPPVTREQAIAHHRTRSAIGSSPRNMLGIALLRALNMQLPAPPQPRITQAMIDESTRRIQQMRKEAEAANTEPEKLRQLDRDPGKRFVVDTSEAAVEELRDSVTRAEAQTTFEAHMRASQLRETLKA